jgi:hypothetical protein
MIVREASLDDAPGIARVHVDQQIEIGGVMLNEAAYGWIDTRVLVDGHST